jgi:hypothetical protein
MRRGVCTGHWRSSKKGAGRVGGHRGRETWRRARVRMRRSTAGAGKVELTRQAHGTERKGDARGNGSALANRARETERERERERTGEGNWRRQVGSTGQRAREGGREREREPPLTGGVHLSGGAGARARGLAGLSWAGWAAFLFSFSLDFLIPFYFFFYRVFKSKFKLGFNFK